MAFLCFLGAGVAAVRHFGWWDGLGLTFALYALMPYQWKSQ